MENNGFGTPYMRRARYALQSIDNHGCWISASIIECNHLKRYILAHRCDACDAAPGRHHHKVKATKKAKRKDKSNSKTAAPVATVITPAFNSQNPLAEQLNLEFSTITDAIDPSVTITESLVRLFRRTSKNPSDYPDITQMRNMSNSREKWRKWISLTGSHCWPSASANHRQTG